MICNAKPYEGTEAFLFVSYSRKDSGIAYPLIERLASAGVRLWFDSGIHGGEIWPEVIADHLNRSAACLVLMSQSAVKSHNCFNELIFAVENKKPLIPIRYNDAQLTMGMRLMIGSVQWIDVHDIPGDSVVTTILSLDAIKQTCGYPDRSIQIQAYQPGAAENEKPKPEKPKLPVAQLEPTVSMDPVPTPVTKPEPVPVRAAEPAPAPVKKPEPVPVQIAEPAPAPVTKPAPAPIPVSAPKAEAPKPAAPAPEPGRTPRRRRQHDHPAQEISAEAATPAPAAEEDEDLLDKTVADFDDGALDRTVAANVDVPPTIVILSEDGIRRRGKIGVTRLGRTQAKADIVVNDPERKVSGCHAQIVCFDGKSYVEDMNSTNGTWVDGKHLEKEEKVNVRDICDLALYRQHILVAFGDKAETLWRANALLCLCCEETDERKYLWNGIMKLGRSAPWREGVLQSKKVSHEHAEILISGGKCILKDLNSTNGTMVNGSLLEKGGSCELTTGDIIQIDMNHFVVKVIDFTGGVRA